MTPSDNFDAHPSNPLSDQKGVSLVEQAKQYYTSEWRPYYGSRQRSIEESVNHLIADVEGMTTSIQAVHAKIGEVAIGLEELKTKVDRGNHDTSTIFGNSEGIENVKSIQDLIKVVQILDEKVHLMHADQKFATNTAAETETTTTQEEALEKLRSSVIIHVQQSEVKTKNIIEHYANEANESNTQLELSLCDIIDGLKASLRRAIGSTRSGTGTGSITRNGGPAASLTGTKPGTKSTTRARSSSVTMDLKISRCKYLSWSTMTSTSLRNGPKINVLP